MWREGGMAEGGRRCRDREGKRRGKTVMGRLREEKGEREMSLWEKQTDGNRDS